jgi:hypothetical protein
MSPLGRDEENLDGTMEKAVSNILQTFMIHELWSWEKRNKGGGREVWTKDTSTQRDQNGLHLVITKRQFH